MSFKIIGSGSQIPSKKISNNYVAKKIKKTSSWIFNKTGIKTRYFVDVKKKETSSFLGFHASLKAIKKSKINKKKINFIISCNYAADYLFPCLASKIAKLIHVNCGGFDIAANCASFQLGMSVADGMFKSNKKMNYILLVGTAVQSKFINWNSAENSMYFGDGSGAILLKRTNNPKYGILSHEVVMDHSAYEDVKLVGGGTILPSHFYKKKNIQNYLYEMSGIETWKQVITNQPNNLLKALKNAKLRIDQIDYFIFHQANKNLIMYLAKKLSIPEDKIIFTLENYGNTADASVAITLDHAIKKRKIKKGNLILFSSVGAGFIYCSTVYRWH